MSSTQSADLIQFGGDRDDNAMKIDSGIVVAVEAMESESSSASVVGQNEKNLLQVCILNFYFRFSNSHFFLLYRTLKT